MLLTITIVLVALFLTRKNFISDKGVDRESALFYTLGISVLSLVFVLFFGLGLPTRDVPDETIRLETMNLSMPEVSGSFFLGTGYIGSDEYYKYRYYVGDTNILRDGKVIRYNDDVALINLIRDQTDGTAYVVVYRSEFKQEWFRWIAFFPSNTGPTVYDFHLPVDSIIPEIDIQE
ncbi:hypothetical protein A3K29_04865 [Candidatus Collierbacteria bacterium RIFOXYB2_FULL_46_14]|uniref:Uncharacterized protein n=1 Tax=Candidatus Collierbacteria bacterium GW2011_GWA2_46_26 TaxID=1618381 RepID=A0A0G1PK94_9BACT|nr:MAG: hypothetical protein UX47_C0006G0063 [Candidatus Collierbacteria bacterium GW2011_GWA2_46_26]OGD73427.1 MAG: hypothetical protein A3K29_04865 [Candidatus Collierbacteria bacterium RIFOXYB2_FULL_46_14]OGD76469.1 MAG: hypothetical protein A3K43_04865 [Candidatus Collierbacteria bacterium RIFOXYA2_FULL_46_20]OGD77805.1 MAG: hypothetical protein A3K39_04865 [Candidatus Collierbacteria bacterium RIFOXYC2_FULL_43_15]OGD81095.1 MAG: hypothetical protein A2320_05360 [Pseudomonadales bacterium G